MLKPGTKLLQLRSKKGYTQDYVADILGIEQSAYSRLESDKMQPNSELLPELAKLYGISILDLFPDEERQYVNISQYSDQSFSAFHVYQDSQQVMEKLVQAKDVVIALLRSQIATLEEENKRLKECL